VNDAQLVQELSRKGLAASDVDAALRDLFGERMTLELEFSEDAEARRPAGPEAQFGALRSHTVSADTTVPTLCGHMPVDARVLPRCSRLHGRFDRFACACLHVE